MGDGGVRFGPTMLAGVLPALILAAITGSVWWLLIPVLMAAVFYAGARVNAALTDRRTAEVQRQAGLVQRANVQHRWAQAGDSRGVYGVAGAELMKSLTAATRHVPLSEKELASVATVADTPEGLKKLLRKRPPCWRWAAFGSVLVQRRAAVAGRVRDCQLGYGGPTGRTHEGFEAARFVVEFMRELADLVDEVTDFMEIPAFMGMFGSPDAESTADGDGIVHIGDRLMDYHERFLQIAERCLRYRVVPEHRRLIRDCLQVANIPLTSYDRFIDEFVERVAELPELLRYAPGSVEAAPVVLHMDIDDGLLDRISKGLERIR